MLPFKATTLRIIVCTAVWNFIICLLILLSKLCSEIVCREDQKEKEKKRKVKSLLTKVGDEGWQMFDGRWRWTINLHLCFPRIFTLVLLLVWFKCRILTHIAQSYTNYLWFNISTCISNHSILLLKMKAFV